MIRNRYNQTYPTVLAAVEDALRHSRFYPTNEHLALGDLQNLQASLEAIIASAHGAVGALNAVAAVVPNAAPEAQRLVAVIVGERAA